MFFKKNYYSKDYIKDLKDFGFELSLAILEKIGKSNNRNSGREILNYEIIDIYFEDNDGKEKYYNTVLREHSERESAQDLFLLLDGAKFLFELKRVIAKDIVDVCGKVIIRPLTEIDLALRIKSLNEEKYEECLSIVDGFKEVIFEKIIFDKMGEEFKIEIIDNQDTIYNDYDSSMILNLLKNDIRVGYLKLMYREDKYFDHYIPTVFHEYEDMKMIYHKDRMPFSESAEGIMRVMEGKRILKNVNYEDPEKELKKQSAKVNRKYKRELTEYRNLSRNISIPTYAKIKNNSHLNDVDFQNRGLGILMYFYASKVLASKGISLRGSLNRTEEAERLWNSIEREFPDLIKSYEAKYYDDIKKLLKFFVPNNETVLYENGKLKRNSEVEDYLLKKSEKKSIINNNASLRKKINN